MSGIGGLGSEALYSVVTNPAQVGAKPEEAELLKHHLKNGKGFVNPWDSYRDTNAFYFLRTTFWRRLTGQANIPSPSNHSIIIRKPVFHPTRTTPKLRATWLGHACYHVEFPSGLRVLFDPVFEDCCAPIAKAELKRFTPPPCEIEDLPTVDIVVISHNHYDHQSYPSTQRILRRFPNAHFFVPLGNRAWFLESGVKNCTELDWWDTRDVRLSQNEASETGVEVTKEGASDNGDSSAREKSIVATIGALPCQHGSARTPFDRCKTLWASWSIESGGAKVYFAGDTGYRSVPCLPPHVDDYGPDYAHLPHCPAFAQIGLLRGPFDLGLIPIGAYAPRFLVSPMHSNPRDSVNIFLDTKCRKALGMHWGTWTLTEESVMEPPELLAEACREKGLGEGVFGVVDIGESREFETGEGRW